MLRYFSLRFTPHSLFSVKPFKLLMKGMFTAFLCFAMFAAKTQSHTINGIIKDKNSGETIIGATIKNTDTNSRGTSSNEYGFFSITLNKGHQQLLVQAMGYKTDTIDLELDSSFHMNILLEEESAMLDEVTINATKNNDNLTRAEMGVEKIDIKEINKIPVLFGEKDIMKTIQLLPGVKSTGDGNSGISVRGGAIDQNLILLDEALVYNASHLLGFFSTFNSDVVKDITVYKGTQPAQYGGRLSSVLDVRMKEGNQQKTELNGSLGLISSKLSYEAPIVKNKGSFLVSARRTYADLFLNLSHNDRMKNSELYFYDINAKANYHFGSKDVVFLSGYFGRDRLGLDERFLMDWGNATGTLRWNHIMGKRSFSNTSFIVSDYKHSTDVENAGSDFNIYSQIRDYTLKHEIQYFFGQHAIRTGINSTYHNITPGRVEPTGDSPLTGFEWQKRYSLENAIFIQDNWKPGPRFNLNAGIRLSMFTCLGAGDFYVLNENRTVTDTITYSKGKTAQNFFVPEPRLTASFMINENQSIKISYTRNAQYLHLVSNNTPGSPTDKWIPSNNNILPEIADQVSAGQFINLNKNMFELGTEVYYKYMQNQVDYKNGANIVSNDAIETQLLSGIGRAYGIEICLRKKTGKFTGWISYTLSRSEKKISGINDNHWYAARQDRTHDISVVGMYQVNSKINLSATWVYNTGNAITYPTGKYYVDQQVVWLYTERNGYRMPAYHRLDFSATFDLKGSRHFENEISLGIYNLYGRENPYLIEFRESETQPGVTETVQTALFRFVPSVTWNFKIK